MRPPAILQNNWLRRVMLDLQRPAPHVESFFIKANDPRHDRALWVRLTLFSDGKETFGEAWAIVSERGRGATVAVKERWPVSRILADPERPGVGIGPCAIEEGRSYGLVQGENHAVAWDLSLTDEAVEYRHLSSERLYRSALLSNKLVSPHPSSTLQGRLELWKGKHRRADCERIDIGTWRGMQGHNWGRRSPEDYAWAHCNLFAENGTQAYFEGLAARPRVAGILQPNVMLGSLVLGEQTYRFESLLGAGQKNQQSALGWTFGMSGPDGTLDGEVRAATADAFTLTYQSPGESPVYVTSSLFAELTLTLTPKSGASRSLHSSKAMLEVGRRQRPSDVPVVL